MIPASEIIARCGGNKVVADWLGLERTAVQRWTYDPPKGTGERIPTKHWASLIAAAQSHNIMIALDELIPVEVAQIAPMRPRRRAR